MRAFESLVVASLNRGKLEEFEALFKEFGVKVLSPEAYIRNSSLLAKVERHDPGATYRDNATRKCRALFQAAKLPTVADDSGLEIEILKGMPGVISANFASEVNAGENRDAANRRKVLEALRGKSNRRARFRAVLVFQVEGIQLQAEGFCEGEIAEAEAGVGGFGYDSIFIPDGGGGKRFSEMTAAEKNIISHRAQAVKALMTKVKDRQIEFVRP